MKEKTNREYISEYTQLYKECDMLYHSVAVKAGVSDCVFWILYTLTEAQDQYTQSEICDYVSMSRQTVNSALKKMKAEGYLHLVRASGKTGKYIQLTEKGKLLSEQIIVPVMLAEDAACNHFKANEKDAFLKTFHSLIRHLKAEMESCLTEETG